jgi:3-oxoacyl-[acyl-carrier protein] reductase
MIVDLDINLTGKTALITGAGGGIGKIIAIALAERGASVYLTSRNSEKLASVIRQITEQGGKAFSLPADLGNENEIFLLFKEFYASSSNLDILINGAGVGIFGNIEELNSGDFNRTFDINVKSMFLVCKEALKLMATQNSGYIINIASVQGFRAYKKSSLYSASKHAVMGLTKALAIETQEKNIRVSAILPGGVDTDFIDSVRPDLEKSGLIKPEDIAKTVLYLLSISDRAMVDEIYIRRSNAAPF